jgi:hypothetical protein
VREQGYAGGLPFTPQTVGSHWSKQVQADVVAVDFQNRQVLLGECKWGAERVDRQVVRDLVEFRAPLVLRHLPDGGQGWAVHYTLFGRAGFTPAAAAEARRVGATRVDAARLDAELG